MHEAKFKESEALFRGYNSFFTPLEDDSPGGNFGNVRTKQFFSGGKKDPATRDCLDSPRARHRKSMKIEKHNSWFCEESRKIDHDTGRSEDCNLNKSCRSTL